MIKVNRTNARRLPAALLAALMLLTLPLTAQAAESGDDTAACLRDAAVKITETETLHLQQVQGEAYLFLPACVDLRAVPMSFSFEGGEALTLRGAQGSLRPNGTEATVDLDALCGADSGNDRTLTLAIGERGPMTVHVMRASVGALFLRSADPDAAGRAYVDESKEHKARGSMLLLGPDGDVIYDGAVGQIKARGNTTFSSAPKKSYQIKLDAKSDLIGIGEKNKTWVLLAGYADATQMHDKLLKDLAAALGMPYTPRNDWVDLYYDGEYRGIYLLGEKVSVGAGGVDIADLEDDYAALNPGYGENAVLRIGQNRFGQEFRYTEGLTEPEDLSGGYLLELNNTKYDEASGFLTAQGVALNVKSPEWAGRDAMTAISEYYQSFENAVYAQDADGSFSGVDPESGKRFDEFADLRSLVQMYLLEELSGNVDAFYSSFFFYKDRGGMLFAGPAWDLDSTFGSGWSGIVTPGNNYLNGRYLAKGLSQIPAFREAVNAYYAQTFRAEAGQLPDRIAAHRERIIGSVEMNGRLWPLVRLGNPDKDGHLWPTGTTYDDTVEDLARWIAERLDVMDRNHPAVEPTATPEPTSTPEPTTTPEPTAPEIPFEDVAKGSYYYDAVVWAHGKSVTAGVSPTAFAPDGNCTRAQIVTFLWRAAGCPVPEADAPVFADVAEGSYCETAVRWAAAQGITLGTDKTHFSPNDPCTRAQAVTFLFRMQKASPPDGPSLFTDVADSAYYAGAAAWAGANGIVLGTTPTTFSPDLLCSRAHIVTILWRCFGE